MKSWPKHLICILLPLIVALSACQFKISQPYPNAPDTYIDDTDFKVVGYLAVRGFERIDDIELDKLTHLNLAFANPDKQGKLIFSRNADVKPVVHKGHQAGVKVFVSLAGGGTPDTAVWNSVLKPENLHDFVGNILDYVEENQLDGVDVDIEWNLLPYIGDGYTPFVLALRDALHARGKGITTALGATGLHESVSQESLEAYDFINVMVYDKTGTWRPDDIGQHSPYSYAEEAIEYWTRQRSISADKIVLGVPFYGFDFTPPARYASYSEIIRSDVENAYQDSLDLLYYNGIPTIMRKAELAREKLGGIMIWELTHDSLNSDLSLLRVIDQTLKAGDCQVKTYFKDPDGDGVGDPSHPFQACEAPDGFVDIR